MMMRTMQQQRSSASRHIAAALAFGLGLMLAACGGADGASGGADDASGGYGGSAGMDRPATSEATDAPTPVDGAVVAVTDDARFGPILTDESGMTLYLFTADSRGVSTCVDGCLAAWPPLLTDGEPSVQGAADATLLGTLTRDDGNVQVTYDGWPLYFFAADMVPGDVAGQGVNDVWFVVAPDGGAVEDDVADEDDMRDEPASDGGYDYGY
jgi:predicted lipoprotein with Yx(FWY)xxD motif